MLGSLFRWYRQMDLRRRGRLLLALSLLLGITAGTLASRRLQQLEHQLGTQTSVLVAAREIEANVPIEEGMLQIREVPLRWSLQGMIPATEKPNLVGKVARVSIPAGDVLTASMFAKSPLGDSDYRTYALSSSPRVVFSGLKPGDRVDVLAVYRKDDEDRSEITLRDVPVVAVEESGRQQQAILALTPQQAERLAWYENFGRQVRLLRRAS